MADDAAPKTTAPRKRTRKGDTAVVGVKAKATHPVRPAAQRPSVEETHREIAARYPKVLAELAK